VSRKVILYELNEVPFKVVDYFCRWHPDSTLARVLPRSRTFETMCEETGDLSPWITWPSVHRGVSGERHTIHDFGQPLEEIDREFAPVWQLLARNGVSTGLCGSLHTYPLPKNLENYSFILPDTFAAGSECFPRKLTEFQRFNLNMARESARNVETRVPWADALKFLAAAPDLGLRPQTFVDVGGHLLAEGIWSWKKVRRRTYQSVLAFDVFMRQLESTRPSFSTFFTNHVASSQHRFWAAAFPDDYESFEFTQEWVQTYFREIDFTMRKADAFLARLVQFADANPEYVVWVATSMGQAATQARPLETQLYAVDVPKLLLALGVPSDKWQRMPAMLPQVNVLVDDSHAPTLRASLRGLDIAGARLSFRERDRGFFSLDFGHANLYETASAARLHGVDMSFEQLGLANVEIQDKSGTTAYHVPQGCLIVYDPRSAATAPARAQISTLDIAPALLRNFAVPIPPYMRRPAAGIFG
jgi:hypothetical protein